MSQFRSAIQDVLLADLADLTFENSSNKLFVEVKPVFRRLPTGYPSCELIPLSTGIEIYGNETDLRQYGYTINVYEYIDVQTTDADTKLRVDRLANIEDRIYDFLEKIPNHIEYAVANCHCSKITPTGSIYLFDNSEQGVVLNLEINFNVEVTINVMAL